MGSSKRPGTTDWDAVKNTEVRSCGSPTVDTPRTVRSRTGPHVPSVSESVVTDEKSEKQAKTD